MLEIGSYSGQHAIYIASELSDITWQPSDLASIVPELNDNLAKFAPNNVETAIEIDLFSENKWPKEQFDAVFTANTLHIMSWQHVEKLFQRLSTTINNDGFLIVYGPFKYDGQFSTPSNASFDLWLKQRDKDSGIRDFDAIKALAENIGLVLQQDIAMPANNQLLIFKKLIN